MNKIAPILCLLFLCGNVFAQTQSGLQTRLLTSFDGLSADHVKQTIEDNNGMIWFATNKGLNRYDGKNIQRYVASKDDKNSIPHNDVRTMLLSKSGQLWIGTQKGLAKKLENNHFIPINNKTLGKDVFPSTQIVKLLQCKNNNIWIATQKGIVIMDPDTKDYCTYKQGGTISNFPYNDIANMYEDSFGNVWISTWSAGIIFASSNQQNDIHNIKFTFLTNEDLGLPKNITFTQIFQDHVNKIWMQESYGSLYRFDINNLSNITQLNKEAVSITMHDFGIFDNHKNHITASNYMEGIGMIVSTMKETFLIPDSIIESPNKNSNVEILELEGLNIGMETKQEIYIDSRKIIWIASNKGVFMQFGFVNNLFEKLPAYQSFTDDIRLSAIFNDERGTWMGSDDGLYLDNGQSIQEIKEETNAIKYVTSFAKAKNGDLWVGNILGELFQIIETKGGRNVI